MADVIEILKPFKYDQMEHPTWGGAACTQMVLESDPIKAGPYAQTTLYWAIRNHSVADPFWTAGPDGVEWVMDNLKSPGFGGVFVIYALNTQDAITRKLIWTIHHYGVAPIVLVFGSPEFGAQHWVVVRGYRTSAHPTSSVDTSYTIKKLYVTNPFPSAPAAPGPKGAWVDYSEFKSTYLRKVSTGTWAGKYVAVCDPAPAPEQMGEFEPPRIRLAGDRIMDPDMALEFAMEELREPEFEEVRERLAAAKPAPPMLVQRLDMPESFYYIVPFGDGAAMRFDARFGTLLESVLGEDRASLPVPIPQEMERSALLKRLEGRPVELMDGGRLPIRPEITCVSPALVWKPCLESLDPMYPFWMLTVGDHKVFVRIDGEVFSALHDDNAGI